MSRMAWTDDDGVTHQEAFQWTPAQPAPNIPLWVSFACGPSRLLHPRRMNQCAVDCMTCLAKESE